MVFPKTKIKYYIFQKKIKKIW